MGIEEALCGNDSREPCDSTKPREKGGKPQRVNHRLLL
jgi:hypothetical protein